MIKTEPNYLDLLNMRQVDVLPHHFTVLSFPYSHHKCNQVTDWIYDNCKGRFYVNRGLGLTDNIIENVIKIGFEESKEASYFLLACPYLNS